MSEILEQKIDRLDNRIDHLDQRVGQVEQGIGRLNQSVGQVEQRMDHLDRKFDSNFERIFEDISEIKVVLGKMDTKIDEREKATEARFQDHEKRIDRLGFQFSTMISGILLVLVGFVIKAIY